MKTVLGYLRPYAGRAACGVLIKFSAAVLELILPLLLANVIDVLVPARDLPAIWRTGGLMLVLAFGAAAGNILANRMAARVSMEMTRDLRRDLYHQIQHLPCARADRYSASSLVSRLTNDTYNIHQMFDKIQRGGVRAPMLVLGGLTLTFLLEPVLALVQFCVSLLTFLTIFLVTRRGVPFYGEAQSAVDTVVRILRENAAGVRVIKALASQRREQDRFEQANRRDRAAEERAGRVMALTNPITDLLLNLGLTLVVLVGAVQVNAGAMPAGQIVAFLTYFTLIQSATLGIAKIFLRVCIRHKRTLPDIEFNFAMALRRPAPINNCVSRGITTRLCNANVFDIIGYATRLIWPDQCNMVMGYSNNGLASIGCHLCHLKVFRLFTAKACRTPR